MFLSCWLTSVRNLFSQRRVRGPRTTAARRWRRGDAGQHLEQLEARQVMAFDFVSAYPNVGAFITDGTVEREAPQQITIKFSPGSKVDPQYLQTGITVTRSGNGVFDDGIDDIIVGTGSITVDDFPNQNLVNIRFAETLPDDSYRISISGAGAGGLRTLSQGAGLPSERFRDGGSFQVDFRLDLGAQVVSVVPQPVSRPKILNFGTDLTQYKDGDLLEVSIRGGKMAFEFDTDGKVGAGRRAVTLAGKSAAELAGEIATALSSSGAFGSELAAATLPIATRINIRGANFTPVVSFTRSGAVPAIQPIAIADGPTLTQAADKVAVYFNANDPLTQSSAQNPRNYRLMETDPATGANVAVQVPQSVSYDATSGTALLTFEAGKLAADKLYRLQVGNSTDENNLVAKAVNVGSLFAANPFVTDSFLGDGADGANDVDLYRVSVTAAGTIAVGLVPGSGFSPQLRLFSSVGTQVAAAAGNTLTYAALSAGTYYLGVSSAGNAAYDPSTGSGATGGTTRGSYKLTLASNVSVGSSDDNSSFATATSLGAIGLAGQSVSSSIDVRGTVPTPAGNLLFPSQPGTGDEPGHRDIPVGIEAHGMPDSYVDAATGMTVSYYNFKDNYGTDPQGNPLHNAITEEQKQRAREIFTLFSMYAGIRFVESANQGLTVVTGDVRAVSPGIPPTAVGGICGGGLAVMNSTIDWGKSEYGGGWFTTAMHEIGHSIGLGHAYDIPSVMGAGESGAQQLGENILPLPYDIDHINVLYPKTGSDIDVYKFSLDTAGSFSAQTVVARQGQAAKSELDTVLTLYKEVAGVRTLVARNDDYYGRDSFVGLDLDAGTYYLAVTAKGNTAFNPEVADSGYGGQSDGAYDLRVDFTPVADVANTIVDATGTALDGDRDGKAGGAFDFWFNTASSAGTIWVDKAAANTTASVTSGSTSVTVPSTADLVVGRQVVGTGIPVGAVVQSIVNATTFLLSKSATATSAAAALNFGTLSSPYRTISAAISAVTAATKIVRIVGNTGNDASPADEKPYLVGTTLGGTPLSDGGTFNVPKGVTVMMDAGVAIKLRAAIIDVGSSSGLVSRAGAALQVLGTPDRKVLFTSYHDDAIGGDSDGVGPAVQGGQWGGIVLRKDSDSATRKLFLNSISQSVIKYGGGNVLADSQLQAFSPIHVESTRPTLAFNDILASAGAAISADPNAFEDSNGRYGPEVRGNRLLGNTINGLFVRIRTEFGSPIDKLDVPARFKSTDITYVIQENLVLAGGTGGYLLNESTGNPEARATGRLVIDPGVVVKLQGARIELERGNAQLIAEGTAQQRVIFTSLGDNRYGAGGTFDTNGNAPDVRAAGDWAGIVIQAGSSASIDHAYVAYGGGQSAIEGGFDRFDVFEVQQGGLRLANSRVEFNASGRSTTDRNARGTNDDSTVFVRDAAPTIVGNDFRDNSGATISVNANSFSDVANPDMGRTTGTVDRYTQYDDNVGPLLRDNAISNKINYASDRQKGAFNITLEYGAGVTQAVRDAMQAAADRWETVITGDLTSVKDGTTVIDDILVHVQAGLLGGTTDGAGGTLANATPTAYRSATDKNKYLPYKADVGVDMADATSSQLVTIMTHELGHALGFTSVAGMLGFTAGGKYTGPNAVAEYRSTFDPKATYVPLEAGGGAGTAYAHWDEATFESEILTGYLNPGINPLTRLTIGAMQDFGYSVNYSAADDYLPKSGTVGYAQPVSGVVVRGEQVMVNSVWDDTDIVHVLTSEITVDNFHTATGLRLQSQYNASLVVKLDGPNAGFTATGTPGEIDDRIGGTVQIVGQPGYPVVLTSLYDDTVGASLDPLGRTVTDTNNDGRAWIDATATAPVTGGWRSLKFLPLSNDTNVAVGREAELPYTNKVDVNATPSVAQVIGVLAPNFATGSNSTESAQNKGSDENRRDGFQVRGSIATDDTGDVDVYSFTGYAGSEVWLDIDKTTSSLDTMMELLDAGGNVLARSVDGQFDTGTVTPDQPETVAGSGAGVQRAYQLGHGNVLPGTLTGSIYYGNTIVQTFTVDRAGAFTFTSVGTPARKVNSATLDRDTGLVTFTWNGALAVTSHVDAGYSYGNLSLATLGYTATGANGALPLEKDQYRGNDYFTTNPRDAGMRAILPGTAGNLNTYFVRVRSQPNVAPTATRTAYEAALTNPDGVTSGATSGSYELNVRLRQRDEVPGSTVVYADVRYATIGIDVQGLPRNSVLSGTTGQENTNSNNTFIEAQSIGKLLQSDQNTISLAGSVASASDVKWFKFSVDYAGIQAIGGVNGGGKTWATVLDIDYADGFRGDLTMAVFDSAGKLIYMGRDSNVAADQPGAGQGNDFDDLSRGSVGKLDPYIGSVQLPAGATPANPTEYYVAIMSNATLPSALDATFKSGATNALVRLEPVDSVQRVIEDHVGSIGYASNGLTVNPTQGPLINVGTSQQLSANVRAFNLADVPLFVSTGGGVYTANALNGKKLTTLKDGGYYGDGSIGDIDMRTDGKLFQYFGQNWDDNNVGHLKQIDTGTGAILTDAGDAIAKVPDSPGDGDWWKLTSSSVDAVAIARTDVGKYENAVFYSVRSGGQSLLYWGRTDGNASWNKDDPPYSQRGTIVDGTGGAIKTETLTGAAGTDVTYQTASAYVGNSMSGTLYVGGVAAQTFTVSNWGWVNFTPVPGYSGETAFYGTADSGTGALTFHFINNPGATSLDVSYRPSSIQGLTTGLQFRNENYGTLYGVSAGGQFYTVSTSDGTATLVSDFSAKLTALGDGTKGFQGLTTAPVNLEGGRYAGMFFAITDTGRLACIDVANKKLLENVFDNDGDGVPESSISNAILGGATGLAFSPVDVNLWHPTTARGADAGHGINVSPDNARSKVDGGTSMYFGLEKWAGADNTYNVFNPTGTNGQYGAQTYASYNWQQDLTSNGEIGGNYNVPGGTQGSLVTNSFSLAGYAGTDKPALYFTYFLDTQNAQGNADNHTMRDSARVLVSVDNGLTWELAATNNQARSDLDKTNAELPNTLTASSATGTSANQSVQELFDSSGSWRQARVDLAKWAGKSNIQLRFDFATAGMMDSAALRTTADEVKSVTAAATASTSVTLGSISGLRVGMVVTGPGVTGQPTVQSIGAGNVVTLSSAVTLAANDKLSFFDTANRKLNDITANGNSYGDLGSSERGQNNKFEGFYVDDIVVGFAERGEMVTGAVAAQTDTFSVATPTGKTYPQQSLQGAYQLEIRRGTEYAVQLDSVKKDITIAGTIDTNDSLVQAPSAPAQVLEENVVDAIGGALSKSGNGRIQWPAAALLAQAGLEAPAGDTFAILDSNSTTSQQNNLLAWSVNLAGQTKGTLAFQYLTLPAQEYQALPPTFTTPTVGGQKILPSGDGVAISVDGGANWKTIAALGNTMGNWSKVSLDLATAGVTLSATTQIGFFQAGKTQLNIAPGLNLKTAGGIALDDFRITVDPVVENTGTIGDQNHPRTQGQFVIANNVITSASQYGISITAGGRDAGTGNPNPGTVANMAVLNNPQLVAGAVAMNNVIANSGRAGILFAGDPGRTGAPNASVPFGRIVNNTIWGGDSSGTGIEVRDNAAPTILNNLFSDLSQGITVDSSSRLDGAGNKRTVIGTSAYWQVGTQVSGADESSPISLSGNPFVNAAGGNFYLVAGSEAIDSSINTLQDRPEYVAVKSPLGVQQSPVVAPDRDLYGQLRVDDPTYAGAPGLGTNVFKDRGAIDRVDVVQPTIAIVDPVDGSLLSPVDMDGTADSIRLERADGVGITQFVLQLNDVGVGIDKKTVVSSAFVVTVDVGDGVKTVLQPGVDYLFRYLQNTNRVIFESIRTFPLGTYTIEATTRAAATGVTGLLVDLANNTLLPNKVDGTTSFQVALADVPSAPQSLVGTRGDSQVTLAWAAPLSIGGTPIIDYLVQFSTDGGSTWTTFDDGVSSATGATVTGLVNGTTYVFRVQGRNAVNYPSADVNDGVWTLASLPVKPLAPASAPTNLAANGGNASARLTWTAPSATGGAPLTDYLVQYSTDGGSTWTTFTHPASTATTITVTGLVNGVEHVFRVAGVTEYGPGLSSQVSIVVVPMTTPDAPTALAAKLGDTVVDLTWTDNFNGGSTVVSHVIQYRVSPAGSWQTFTPPAPVAGQSVRVTGLTNGTPYEFRVAAHNGVGDSAWSNLAGPVTPVAPASAPQSFTATGGNGQATLAWGVPASDGGSAITDYRVQASVDGGATWYVIDDGVSASTGATILGLVNGTTYVFRVAAITAYNVGEGVGAWSAPSAPVTPMTVATAPSTLAGVRGDTKVDLTWTAPANTGGVPVTDYLVEYQPAAGGAWTAFSHAPSASTAISVTGLVNGSSYLFRVSAVNAAGTSAPSNVAGPLTPMTTASAPLNLAAAFGDKKVTLTWSAPASNGGGAISDYVVQYKANTTGAVWTTFPHAVSTATSMVVTGLVNGTAYNFRVAAKNPVGSGATALAGPITPMTIASAPVITTVTPGDSKVDLTWNAPASNGGGAITNYLIEYKIDAANALWTRYPRAASTALAATVAPLVNGTRYLFRVSAVNPAGTGPASVASPSVMPVTFPAAPATVTAVGGDKQATLSWTKPVTDGGLPITDYVVEYRRLKDADWTVFADGTSTATTATVTGLLNGANYAFRVRAVSSFGTGVASPESNYITVRGLAAAPSAPVATTGNGFVNLVWTAPLDNGGAPVTDYEVQYKRVGDAAWTSFPHDVSAATSINVTGLAMGTSYVFRVAAKTVVGTGAMSGESNAVSAVAVPSQPGTVTGTAGDKLVSLVWTAPVATNGSPVTDYVVEYRKSTDLAWTVFADGVSAATSATVTNLVNGTAYVFRVSAKNAVGTSLPSVQSSPVIPVGYSAAPTSVTGTGTRGTVALSWTAPTDTGGLPITGYVVQYRVNMDGQQWTTATWPVGTSATATSATFSGFKTRYGHLFRVAAVTAKGQGAWSEVSAPINPFAS